MTDRGPGFRRVFSWLPAQLGAGLVDDGVGTAPRRFGSTEHLSTEALAAFVDGELPVSAQLRATHHLALCPECSAEVGAQRQARAALRDSTPITAPSTLLGMLSRIPLAPPIPPDDLIPDPDPAPQPEDREGRFPWRRRR
ncbi:anti-sigma E factor RseA [Mycolicibacterium fallax]|jgi:anti-sigma factor ChrR (cupin superfamily)|uniref:RNA polymerase subunit sigma-70 n=1 Tax=Mycolicibacterium fallax TaxID=1793 RepID=A0A1X1R2J5_MYCFA|nr:anti-sigma E factor RseA [Mycolicibacterium fallax]ORU98354.1 RNA polymerase subunit sigma-70 [Mycolicibacterium fallax]BBZ00435.1 hypothetical protein MFAL_39010 [Mycolicibacterium fallax]HSA40507.1 anti-sigma E factor RseA [Mycobacterium sp.]